MSPYNIAGSVPCLEKGHKIDPLRYIVVWEVILIVLIIQKLVYFLKLDQARIPQRKCNQVAESKKYPNTVSIHRFP